MDQERLRKTVLQRATTARNTAGREASVALPDNALPPSSHVWLQNTAGLLGARESERLTFSQSGLLQLDALHVMVICQRELPVPLWLAVGYLRKPPGLHRELWHQVLLRANAVAMGINGISTGLDRQDNALLSRRISFDMVNDAQGLALLLHDFNLLATSLTDLLFSLYTSEPPDSTDNAPPRWTSGWQQALSEKLNQLAQTTLNSRWHHALLRSAAECMALQSGRLHISGVLAELQLPERQISLTADGDGRHLLIVMPLNLASPQGDALETMLFACHELPVATNCTLGLSGEQLCLFPAGTLFALDGEALAGWLADMMTLAAAMESPQGVFNG